MIPKHVPGASYSAHLAAETPFPSEVKTLNSRRWRIRRLRQNNRVSRENMRLGDTNFDYHQITNRSRDFFFLDQRFPIETDLTCVSLLVSHVRLNIFHSDANAVFQVYATRLHRLQCFRFRSDFGVRCVTIRVSGVL